ncbi:MAG TPA: phage holin family protein [Streptomyces sp.]|uniref:phage holin family protein n=1 Tax=Streptomyces sp. TaxID=1931 RepID=UPI002D6D2E9D|nr:phage holin family protein [Streptomyces sp.]HZG05880.1 phage holin family protein [Streptomyces sp.]
MTTQATREAQDLHDIRDDERPSTPSMVRQVAEAADRLAQEASDMLHRQVREARDGLRSTVRRVGQSGALLGGAGVCALLAVGTAHRAALRALESALPRAHAAAVLALVYAAGAGTLAGLGRGRLRSPSRDRAASG